MAADSRVLKKPPPPGEPRQRQYVFPIVGDQPCYGVSVPPPIFDRDVLRAEFKQGVNPSALVLDVRVANSSAASPEKKAMDADLVRYLRLGDRFSLKDEKRFEGGESKPLSSVITLGKDSTPWKVYDELVNDEKIAESLARFIHQSGANAVASQLLEQKLAIILGVPKITSESKVMLEVVRDAKGGVEKVVITQTSTPVGVTKKDGTRVGLGKDAPQIVSQCTIHKEGNITLDSVRAVFRGRGLDSDPAGIEDAILRTHWGRVQNVQSQNREMINSVVIGFIEDFSADTNIQKHITDVHKYISDGKKRELLDTMVEQLKSLAERGDQPEKLEALKQLYMLFFLCNEKKPRELESVQALCKLGGKAFGLEDERILTAVETFVRDKQEKLALASTEPVRKAKPPVS